MSNFMMNMISWILLLLVILTLYLIDKVNHLAKMYEAPKPETPSLPNFESGASDVSGDLLFSGLEGKKLWDAMNGKQVDGFDSTLVDALRPHYEPILRQHITASFKDGIEDALGGTENHVPSSTRKIPTARGHIHSWLPPQHLGSIYRSALEFAGSYCQDPDPEVLLRLKQTVDSVVDMLYQRVGITNEVPFSEVLFEEVSVPHAEAADQGALLALTDDSGTPESLGEGVVENSDVREPTPEELAQGLAHVQAYEDQQRQEIAAETIEAVMPTEELVPVQAEPLDAKPA